MSLFPKFSPEVLSRAQLVVDSQQEKMLFSTLEGKGDVSFGSPLEIRDSLAEISPEIKALLDEIPKQIIDADYIKNVIFPSLFLSRVVNGERLSLPLIDDKNLSKEDAVPYFLWGLLYQNWNPANKKQVGLSVFFQGLADRDDANKSRNNRRKKIYFSAVSPDLYPKYQEKVKSFFDGHLKHPGDGLLAPGNANKPLMRLYVDTYFNLYWNLHVGLTPLQAQGANTNEQFVFDIGQAVNRVLASLKPLDTDFYTDYMKVRDLRGQFIGWVNSKVEEIRKKIQAGGNVKDLEHTFVYYWLKNSNYGTDPDFRTQDIAFECFHNFIALSQWGNTIYGIISILADDIGDANAISLFQDMRQDKGKNYDKPDGNGLAFTPLDRFVMELFRIISPNTGSNSTIIETQLLPVKVDGRQAYITTPHKETSEYDIHWEDPKVFNPDRYKTTLTSDEMNKEKSKQLGFAKCPFHEEKFVLQDGRTNIELTNSIFGTVYAVPEANPKSKEFSVFDYAGYAPFGFGYRRCAGEQFTVEVIKDFLRTVLKENIHFRKLTNKAQPELVAVGPGAIVEDNIEFYIK